MNRNDFVKAVNNYSEQFKLNAQNFRTIGATLPELPIGMEYMSLNPFPLQLIAAYQIAVSVPTRASLPELLNLFPPIKMVKTANSIPRVIPMDALIETESIGLEYEEVFPIVLNLFYHEPHCSSTNELSAVWYYCPQPKRLPAFRILFACILTEDAANITASGVSSMPNGIVTSDNIPMSDGSRSVNVHWPPMPVKDWIASISEVEDLEWPQVITESGEPDNIGD